MKSQRKRIKVTGFVERACPYCGEITELICGEIVGKKESFSLCADCLKQVYGINFKKDKGELNDA